MEAVGFLRNLDLYPKTLDEFRVRTVTGGLLSITCFVLMTALFVAEYKNYFYNQVRYGEEVDVFD